MSFWIASKQVGCSTSWGKSAQFRWLKFKKDSICRKCFQSNQHRKRKEIKAIILTHWCCWNKYTTEIPRSTLAQSISLNSLHTSRHFVHKPGIRITLSQLASKGHVFLDFLAVYPKIIQSTAMSCHFVMKSWKVVHWIVWNFFQLRKVLQSIGTTMFIGQKIS